MNRNVESHFATLPKVNISRSTFDMSHSVKTTGNVGQLLPIDLIEVLPGDTFNVKTSKVIRLQTLVTPMMDNLYADFYHFFVPMRLVWEHSKEFFGENSSSAWIPQVEYSMPQVTSPASTGWTTGSLADYFGLPIGVTDLSVNALPFRCYAKIVEDWFKDENLQDPVSIPVDETTVTGSNGTNYITDLVKGGAPFIAAKFHDYFTSALPAPQKGPDVTIAMADGAIPVYGNGYTLGMFNGSTSASNLGALYQGASDGTLTYLEKTGYGKTLPYDPSVSSVSGPSVSGKEYGVVTREVVGDDSYKTGLVTYLDGLSVVTVNQLRTAFQIQKLFETEARSGSRYIELIKAHFGVSSPDARLQRSEYLGGNRVPVRVSQVVQQSASESGGTPQGTVSGMSLTTDTHNDYTKSFTEHGYVISLMVLRYDHTYQQGVSRLWSRKSRYDFYWPVFAHLGEQAVLNKEIYAQGSGAYPVGESDNPYDDQVFGYQERWAEYRYANNIVTGEMRSNITNTLDSWHLADDYNSLPTLSDGWIREDKANVDRVLAVSSAVSNQFFADIFIKNRATRCMPVHSIPGLIDHF